MREGKGCICAGCVILLLVVILSEDASRFQLPRPDLFSPFNSALFVSISGFLGASQTRNPALSLEPILLYRLCRPVEGHGSRKGLCWRNQTIRRICKRR